MRTSCLSILFPIFAIQLRRFYNWTEECSPTHATRCVISCITAQSSTAINEPSLTSKDVGLSVLLCMMPCSPRYLEYMTLNYRDRMGYGLVLLCLVTTFFEFDVQLVWQIYRTVSIPRGGWCILLMKEHTDRTRGMLTRVCHALRDFLHVSTK